MDKKLTTSVILLCIFLSSVTYASFGQSNIDDTTHNWSWVVPLGEYDYCDIIPVNGLIKVGTKIGEKSLGNAGPILHILVYGLLDREGKPLTEIVFNEIFPPNSDGYMLASIYEEDGRVWSMMINHLGEILPTPEGATITQFDRSYSVETADRFILYVNNKSYSVSKSRVASFVDSADSAGILGVYSDCFILSCSGYVYVFGFDGTLRYKTDRYKGHSPQGIIISNSSGDEGFVDFDGNTIIATSYKGLNWCNNVPGVFTYLIDSADQATNLQFGMIDINNPNAFVGMDFSTHFEWPDYENGIFYLATYKPDKGSMQGLYGFDGKQILPFEYDGLGRPGDGLIRFERGNYTGFVDVDGNVLFEKERYRYDGQTQHGAIYLDTVFTLYDFSEGLAPYWDRDSGCGYINLDFEPVIQLSDEWVIMRENSMFRDGLAAVMFRDELVFINRQGEIVIAAEPSKQPWKYSQGFSNGLAAVSVRKPITGGSFWPVDAYNHGEIGIISSKISK